MVYLVLIGRCVLLLFVASFFVGATSNQNDIELVCANKKVRLTRLSQVRALVHSLNQTTTNGNQCPASIREALVELDRVANENNDDVCSPEKVEQIRDYYLKYVDMQANQTVPTAIKTFFLGLGLKVSGTCKKNMINSLMLDARHILNEQDYAIINKWTDDNSFISKIMNEPSDYDDIILTRDFDLLFYGNQGEQTQSNERQTDKIFLQTATGATIRQIQTVCGRRFGPIYDRLLMPIVALSNIGLNYQGEELERELQEMSVNKEVHQWYRIVYLCDALASIVIVETPEDRAKVEGLDKRLVRVLTQEEAAALKWAPAEEEQVDKDERIEQVVYRPEHVNKIDDLVVDYSDASLINLIKRFAVHKSESDRIRAKIVRKVGLFIKDLLIKGQIRVVGSLMFGKRASYSNGNNNTSFNDNIVKLIDDYTEQATSVARDAPVAGLMKVYGGALKRKYRELAYRRELNAYNMERKQKMDPAAIRRLFWRTVAVLLFVSGVLTLTLGR